MFLSRVPNPVDLLFPPLCELCDSILEKASAVLCPGCTGNLEPTGLGDWVEKLTAGGALDHAWSAFWFYEELQKLLHRLKYSGIRKVGRILGELTFKEVEPIVPWKDIQIIVPVPLHHLKQRERGFNQAYDIARGIAGRAGLPLTGRLLQRRRWTESQTALNIEERRQNMSGAFKVRRQGKAGNVLLIDDVLTTGATAASCAEILARSGYGEMSVLTVATPRLEG